MSRHQSTETFHLDQSNLDPSRSSSLQSQHRDEMDNREQSAEANVRSHKLDLYSIPVFLLELIVLLGLAYAAHYVHFEYQHEPLISGFYCDDIDYRQQYHPSLHPSISEPFRWKQSELTIVALLLVIPIVFILFCELINSMFGSLKFRKIRALCTCCKLHSVTRRSIRFSGAYVLGFLIVMISCDILATTTGRLRPYFAQDCPMAYQRCVVQSQPPSDLSTLPSSVAAISGEERSVETIGLDNNLASSSVPPPSAPISAISNASTRPILSDLPSASALRRPKRAATLMQPIIAERLWIDLNQRNLSLVCNFSGDPHKLQQLAMSWPSFPAAIFTYACVSIAIYLSYVGTARPFRIITCVIVMIIVLIATVFNVQLVKEHYNHWDDVLFSSALAFTVSVFILLVYLNRFRDTHFYENQKLLSKRKVFVHDHFKGYTGDSSIGQFNLDKTTTTNGAVNGGAVIQNGSTSGGVVNGGGDPGVTISNNDLAMRYFQIPRANYRRSNFQ